MIKEIKLWGRNCDPKKGRGTVRHPNIDVKRYIDIFRILR